jgi:hypothetical protein
MVCGGLFCTYTSDPTIFRTMSGLALASNGKIRSQCAIAFSSVGETWSRIWHVVSLETSLATETMEGRRDNSVNNGKEPKIDEQATRGP